MAHAHEPEERAADEWASKVAAWDARPLIQQLTSAAAEALKSRGLLQPSTAVLELGCGTGLLAEKIVDSLGSYVGVDTSPAMVAAFQSKLARRADSKLRCALGQLTSTGLQPVSQAEGAAGAEAEAAAETAAGSTAASAGADAAAATGLQPGQFDLVLSHMTFHHLKDADETLRTLLQYLRPGGAVAVFDLLKEPGSDRFHSRQHSHSVFHPGGFTPEEMQQHMQGAGLVDAQAAAVAPFQREAPEEPHDLLSLHLLLATARRSQAGAG
ncbi:hypothetical protein ABPG75_008541 [Micractinium tetrahymenae]